MKKAKRFFFWSLGALVVWFVCEKFLQFWNVGFAGSYPYAETWEFNAKESDVIEAIKELKIENRIEARIKEKLNRNRNKL